MYSDLPLLFQEFLYNEHVPDECKRLAITHLTTKIKYLKDINRWMEMVLKAAHLVATADANVSSAA